LFVDYTKKQVRRGCLVHWMCSPASHYLRASTCNIYCMTLDTILCTQSIKQSARKCSVEWASLPPDSILSIDTQYRYPVSILTPTGYYLHIIIRKIVVLCAYYRPGKNDRAVTSAVLPQYQTIVLLKSHCICHCAGEILFGKMQFFK